MWEQFKVFSVELQMVFHYMHLLQGEVRPLEAALVYHLRGLQLKLDEIQQARIAVHWLHTDEAQVHRQDVQMTTGWEMQNAGTGAPITVFVADSEVKYMQIPRRVYHWVHADTLH